MTLLNQILIPFLSAALLVFGSCGLRYEREEEENDSFFTSQPLQSGRPVRASIGHEGDIDFYRISPRQDISGDIIADISVKEIEGLDLLLTIYRGNKVIKIINDSNMETGTVGRGERIVNAFFSYDEIMGGNAIFSVEEATKMIREKEKRYELNLQIREREQTDEGEPNDRAVDSTEFGEQEMQRGYFNPSIDWLQKRGDEKIEEDWYSFTVNGIEEQIIHVSHTAVPDVDSMISIYDELGYLIRKADSWGIGEPEKIKNLGLETGRYFIQLSSSTPFQQNERVSYLLRLERGDTESKNESESNDKYPYADLLQFSSDKQGCFNPAADIDWFKFNVYNPEPQIISARISPTADIDPVLVLYTASMEELIRVDDRRIDEGEIIRNMGVEEGVYYLKLFNKDPEVDNPDDAYTLLIEKKAWEEEQEFELNNNRERANEFQVGSLKKGYITPRGDRDFYTFQLSDGEHMQFEVTPCVLLDLAIQIYDEKGNLMHRIDNNPAEEGERGRMFLYPGLYYVEVLSNNIEENSRDTYILRIYTQRS